jgi:hypothetical protein
MSGFGVDRFRLPHLQTKQQIGIPPFGTMTLAYRVTYVDSTHVRL